MARSIAFVGLLAVAFGSACTATISQGEDDAVAQGAGLGTATCPGFRSSNSAHVSAGRATTSTRRVLGFNVTTYLALGTNENLGTSSLG